MKKISTGNTLPTPLARELEGEAAERAWNAAISGGGMEDATVPAHLLEEADSRPPADAAGQSLQAEPSFDNVLAEVRRHNRACPLPQAWARLYRILIAHAVRTGVEPPVPPVDQQAWAGTPSMSKRAVLRAQLEWADAFGCLAPVHAFLVQLPDAQWTLIGD